MRESRNGLRTVDEVSSVFILTTVGPTCSTTLTIGDLRLLISDDARTDSKSKKVEHIKTIVKKRKLLIKETNERRQAFCGLPLNEAYFIGKKIRNSDHTS